MFIQKLCSFLDHFLILSMSTVTGRYHLAMLLLKHPVYGAIDVHTYCIMYGEYAPAETVNKRQRITRLQWSRWRNA